MHGDATLQWCAFLLAYLHYANYYNLFYRNWYIPDLHAIFARVLIHRNPRWNIGRSLRP
jgi:hypothetical protein